MLNLNNNNFERIGHFGKYARINFVIAGCTSCELKAMVSDFKVKQVLDSSKEIVIFPIYASESELSKILEKEKINFPIYLDNKDEFNLFSVITNPQNKLIVIDNKELEEVK